MNRRSFFQLVTGAIAAVYAVFVPNRKYDLTRKMYANSINDMEIQDERDLMPQKDYVFVTNKDRTDFCNARLCPRCEFNMDACMIEYWKIAPKEKESESYPWFKPKGQA